MMGTRDTRRGARGAAVAVTLAACALVLACLFGFGPGAPGGALAADSTGYENAGAVANAKELIRALPADPDAIGEAQRSAVDEATRAYDALSAADRKTLDSEVLDKEQSYGRWLESAQWGLEAATETLDASTDLEDGDYSAYLTSVSSMGKSTSERTRSWSAVKLVAKGGKLSCVIRCDSRSAFKKLRLAGVDYTARVSKQGVPEFEVPMQVNDNLKFTVDASEIADSIAYEMEVKLDLSAASAAEVATAKEVATQGLSDMKACWPSASRKAVRKAANELSRVTGKQGVRHVELQLFQAELATAQKDARAAAKKAAQRAGEKKRSAKRGEKKASSVAARSQGAQGSSGVAGTVATASPAAGAGTAGASAGGAGASHDDSDTPKKKVSGKEAKKLEVNPGGANMPAADAAGADGSVSDASAEPNYALLLGLGLLLLLVLGMVIRSLLFTRAMGTNAKGGGK